MSFRHRLSRRAAAVGLAFFMVVATAPAASALTYCVSVNGRTVACI